MSQIPKLPGKNDNESRRSDMDETKPYTFDAAEIDDGTGPLPLPHRDEAMLDETGGAWPDKPI